MKTIHYIFDPMCGWCYGATGLIGRLQTLATARKIHLELHPGGMIPRRDIDVGFRQHILEADAHIAALTGAHFGAAYQQRVANSRPFIMDSMVTAVAIMAAGNLGKSAFDMLKCLQQAHYQSGLDISDPHQLQQLALAAGLSDPGWKQAIQRAEQQLPGVLTKTRQLMSRHLVRGFPTLLLETTEGWQTLPHQGYYADPDGWQDFLEALLLQDPEIV